MLTHAFAMNQEHLENLKHVLSETQHHISSQNQEMMTHFDKLWVETDNAAVHNDFFSGSQKTAGEAAGRRNVSGF